MKPIYFLLASLAFTPPAFASKTFHGWCVLFDQQEHSKIADKEFVLAAGDEAVVYENGPVKYVADHAVLGDEQSGEFQFFTLKITDSSRDLALSTGQPIEEGRHFNHQVWPPYNLPQALCIDVKKKEQK